MSKVDTVFGPIPGPLIAEWGQNATFVAVTGSGTLDPDTGDITPSETRTAVKVVISKLSADEYAGLYQATDVKIYIDPAQIRNHYITTSDRFELPRTPTLTTPPLAFGDYATAYIDCFIVAGTYNPAAIQSLLGTDYCSTTGHYAAEWDPGTTDYDNASFSPRNNPDVPKPQVAKVVNVITYRGDNPVLFACIARPE